MLKNILSKHNFSIIRLLFLLFFSILFYYSILWFNITIIFMDLNITLYTLCTCLILLFLILQYRIYTKKSQNEFYHFFYWILSLFCFFCIFFTGLKSFLHINYVSDYLINTEYFKINIDYTDKYKIRYISEYLNVYFANQNIDPKFLAFVKDMFIEDGTVIRGNFKERIKTIAIFKEDLPKCLRIFEYLYIIHLKDNIPEKLILDPIMRVVAKIFIGIFIAKILLQPQLSHYMYIYISTALLSDPNIILEMTQIEQIDLFTQLTEIALKKHYYYSLYLLIKSIF